MTTWEIVASILVPVLGILAGMFTIKWVQTKQLFRKSGLFLIGIADAMEDDHISMDELKETIEDGAEVIAAGKDVFS